MSSKDAGIVAPYWVKLVRSGNNFSAFRSADGVTWIQVGTTQTITMSSTVYVGLAVTSHLNGTSCTGVLDNVAVNAAPTVSTAASATPNPVTGTTTNLSVRGSDDGGEANLVYTWTTTGTPPAPVTFSQNGTNAAKNTLVTFSKTGTYNFQVTITDAGGLSTTSSVSVVVPSAILSRKIFYNNSIFDSTSDDNAIATDKQALLPDRQLRLPTIRVTVAA